MCETSFSFFFQSLNTTSLKKSLQADYKMFFLHFLDVKEEYIFNATNYSALIALQHCVCTMNRTNFTDDYT